MNKTAIRIRGCDDVTCFYIDLTDEELALVQLLSKISKEESGSQCMPDIYVNEEGAEPWEKGERYFNEHTKYIKRHAVPS